jgi:Zn-dependent peptidase ImmA (M78 family)
MWALDRARLSADDVPEQLKAFPKWLAGESEPTYRQLQKLAGWTHTPLGFFFLAEPPQEIVPIPDFRTLGNRQIAQPSPDLLDTIYQCQKRQDWYREYALAEGLERLAYVGSMPQGTPVKVAADAIREALHWEPEQRDQNRTLGDARRTLISGIEDLGVLVVVNGVVGANTHRALDPDEFRGLALVDDQAPLIFVNGADSKSAQIFTLIHELAHVWAGDTALSDANMFAQDGQSSKESWANRVAAEVLVPADELVGAWRQTTVKELTARFKVSELVVLKSAFDAGLLEWDDFRQRYRDTEAAASQSLADRDAPSGGDYYKSQPYRLSRRFARAVIADTREGRTLYTDAYELLGVAKHSTFENLAEVVMA